jgi:chemotaxis signal transduction protein
MIDLIVFRVLNNKYAVSIENIQRIVQATKLTNIPNSHPLIEGMMSYEDNVLKVLSFRSLIGLESYQEELEKLFIKLKDAHSAWVDALEDSLTTGCDFTRTINPHVCELGKWIDNFTSYDDSITEVFNILVEYHKQLHNRGGDALELYKKDPLMAKKVFDVDVKNIYARTMGALDSFIQDLDSIANSLQKLLIYESEDKIIAIKVDAIEDIAHIEESEIKRSNDEDSQSEFLELDGILDINGDLINVISSVKIPR